MEPERRLDPVEQPAIRPEPPVIDVGRDVAGALRRNVADDDDRFAVPYRRRPEPTTHEAKCVPPCEVGPSPIVAAAGVGPFEAADEDPGKPSGRTGPERLGDHSISLVPVATLVVVAADVDERRLERVSEKCEPSRVDVTAADDAVDRAHPLTIGLDLHRGLALIGRREQANRPTPAIAEGPVIGPLDRDATDHEDSGFSSTRSSCDSCPTRRPDPAVRSAWLPVMTGASDPRCSAARRPGGTSSVTFASISSWPP